MKANDIEKIYTAKVSEYIAAGYTISTATMSGHQGEIAKIDLAKGAEIIRILLTGERIWSKVLHVPMEGVTLKVLRADRPEARRPFDTWDTLWTDEMEQVEERRFYQPATESDFFTDDLDAYTAMLERRDAHWKNRRPAGNISEMLLGDAHLALAKRYLKRKGFERIARDSYHLTRSTDENGRSTYYITYKRNTYKLH